MEHSSSIAVLEDDEIYRNFATTTLSEAGYLCHGYASPAQLLSDLHRESFDLFVLDWLLPGMSGVEILGQFRREKFWAPVLLVTIRNAELDVMQAFQSGADDYVVKPVGARELIARVGALLRRTRAQIKTPERFRIGPFLFDSQTQTVYRKGTAITMSEKEFKLALHLLRNIDIVLSRASIYESVWGQTYSLRSRSLDTLISRVRAKLQLDSGRGFKLETIYAYGYRLTTERSIGEIT